MPTAAQAPPSPPADTRNPLAPLQIALGYAAASALWILFSDKVLEVWFADPGRFALASAIKGWLFTAVTATLLYGLLRRRWAGGLTGAARPAARGLAVRLGVAIVLIAGLTVAAVGYSVERNKAQELVRLHAVAALKVQQLTEWLRERAVDARMLEVGSDAAAQLRHLRASGPLNRQDPWLTRLQQMLVLTQFHEASLLDEHGELLWQSNSARPAPDAATRAERARFAAQRQLQRQGPYRDANGRLHMDFVVPLATPALPSGQPAPLLVLHLDDHNYLPARLQEWPMPSATGELALLRRDGNEVLHLNGFEKAPDAAMTLRHPLSDKRLVSVQLVDSDAAGSRVVDGLDHHGAAAFGVGLEVPGTDWYLLAKMDRSELYGTALTEELWIVLAGTLALFVAASVSHLTRQRRQLALAAQTQQAQAERLQTLRLLAAIADSSDDAIFAKDEQGRYTLFNQAASRFLGKPPEDVIGLDDHSLFPPDQAARLVDVDRRVIEQGCQITQEERLRAAAGERVFLATKGPLRDAAGAVVGTYGISRDITFIKQAEDELRRANRALLTGRECGHAVMHAHDEAELLRAMCRIVVQTGGYRMCWVGFAEDDAARTVRPVAQCGDTDGYLDSIQVSWADNEHGRGPAGMAIRERRPALVRNLLSEPAFAPWREAAAQHGYAASIALPLMSDADTCIGALCIYAAVAGAFDEAEVRLVAELASDLAFGIRALRDRHARQEAQRLLREQKDRLAESQRIAYVGSWEVDWPTQAMLWSEETFRLHGLPPGSAQPQLSAQPGLVHPDDHAALRHWLERLAAGEGAGDSEFRVRLPDGGESVLSIRGRVERDAQGRPLRLVGTVQDVTEQRHAESERLEQESRYRDLFAANPNPMWVYDRDTLAFLEVNDAAVAKYGYSRAEFLAMNLEQIRPESDLPRLRKHFRQTEASQGSVGVWQHRLKDGGVIDVEISSHSLVFGGKVAGVVMATDVTARRQAEAALHLQARRAEALQQLPELAEALGEAEFMQRAQEIAEDLTGSCIAFIHFVNPDNETIELVTWSRRTLEFFCKATHDKHYPVSRAGIWADALRQRKPVVFNDYAAYAHKGGLPEGHAALDRLISVPVIEGGRVVMLTGVGGKASDYTDADVDTVQSISDETWRRVQRMRADKALAQSEQDYRALTEQVPAIIYRAELDAASTTVYISPGIQALGYSPAEWLADPDLWLNNLHPEDRDRVLSTLHAARQAGEGIDVEYRMRTRGGQWRHFQDKAELVRDAAGQPLHLQGLMFDVTDRLESAAELRKLYQAVEQSPNSVVITNLDARIEYVNQAFLTSTGYHRDEVIGQNPRILKADDEESGERSDMWATLTQGKAWTGEFRNRRKDGSVYVELARVAPLRQPDGTITHYVGVKEDITESKRISQELDRYRQHLEELVQARTAELADATRRAEAANQAKSAFLANMSHEIRTPMNAIVGLSYLLHRDRVTPAQAARLAKIEAAALHLLSIIDGILDLSKIEAGKVALDRSDFPLTEVLDAVQTLIADRAQAKGVAVRIENRGVPAWLHGDATRLRQALLNYADNALKFTAQGSICLRSLLLEDRAGDLLVRLEVQDTGIGIEPDQLPRLFQAFEQADTTTTRRHGGTGLGLALTRRLAGLMGGETGVTSQAGAGSTFWLTAWLRHGLTAPPPEALRDSHDAEVALRQHAAGARVLLTEDDAVNREVATELLRATGMVVDIATDGSQAVRMATTQHYDLVLLDLQMPVMDGFEATLALRARNSLATLPILAMTANAFDDDRQACLAAGMNDFVPKPVDPKVLYSTLLRWLPRRAAAAAGPGTTNAGSDAAPTVGAHHHALQALARIDGLAVGRGLAALRGDLPTYLRMLHSLAAGHGRDAGHLAEQVAERQWELAQQLAHRLKGAAGSLGATGLQEAAADIEAALREAPPAATLPALCDRLRERSQALRQGLAALPDLQRPLPEPGPGEATPDAARVSDVLAELEPLIASDDTAAGALYEAHRRLLVGSLGAMAVTLGQQLEVYDFPAALLTLRHALAARQDAEPPPHRTPIADR